MGNRILHLQEVAVITEALTQKKPTERDLLVIANRYVDEKQIEHTGTLGFFLENFKTVPPASLFEKILLLKEPVSLKEFSEAFGVTMMEMVEVFLQRARHPFYIDPETLVVTIGSHFMEKAIHEKFVLKDNTLKQPTK